MKRTLLLLLFGLLVSLAHYTAWGQDEKTYYHEWTSSASDFFILKRNIEAKKLPKEYLKESVDKKGRVTELKFYKNDSLCFTTLCYLTTWFKYNYPNDTTIICYYLDCDGTKSAALDECEGGAYKIIYHLSKDQKKILKTERGYYVDTLLYLKNGWSNDSIRKTIKRIKEEDKKGLNYIISGFDYSYAKLNGKFPIGKDFQLSQYDAYKKIEKEEIRKALEAH